MVSTFPASDEDRLGRRAARAIFNTPYEQLGISDVTLQEIGLLVHRGKLEFEGAPEEVLATVLDHVTVLPISLEIALEAPRLPLPHGDQFARIICATARHHRIPLVAQDGNITDSRLVDVVW